MIKKFSIYLAAVFLIMTACSKVAITGRKQITLLPKSMMLELSQSNYSSFLAENKIAAPPTIQTARVEVVGKKIAAAVNRYFEQNDMADRIAEFNWEFKVVESAQVNAWCMPGGKVVFYTGILPICQDEQGIAVVMGHEIAHAIAQHGNERMSQQLIAQGLATAGSVAINETVEKNPQAVNAIFQQAFGIGANLGILSFGRKQELESDHLGLIFMSMAGYDPYNAVSFWERMDALSGGQAPPEFLSTHPPHAKRISKIKHNIPEALKYRNK